ncbi:MAG: hypothetical protein K1W34_02560 [Lachnospiraceae bacterium]
MSINIYKEHNGDIPSLIPLGIAMDYHVKWNVHRILRDFIQNFYDCIGTERFADEFQYEWEVVERERISKYGPRKEKQLHIKIKTLGHSFSYDWLTYIGGSTKTGKNGYAGAYGEGFKIALLCLVKLGGDAVMSSGNPLLADRIDSADGYDLYARSEMKVPCAEYADIQGIFFYKYVARGRLPFPAVIHLTGELYYVDHDRSRDILPDAAMAGAIYEVAECLSPEASFWMLTQMKGKWHDFPVFKKNKITDLRTWYYVVCQLVRNISAEPKFIKKFVQEYPPEKYAYLERPGGDSGRNRLLWQTRRWFEQKNSGKDKRTLINPVFRLVGVSSVLQEYQEHQDTLYRELDEKEEERAKLLNACARVVLSAFDSELPLPGIRVRTEKRKKINQVYLQYGLLPNAETKVTHVFSRCSRRTLHLLQST